MFLVDKNFLLLLYKKTNKINFVYLDLEIGGFAVHLINPDVQMEV